MVKKVAVLTRPAPARRDAAFRGRGRSEREGEEVHTALRVSRSPFLMCLGERVGPSTVFRSTPVDVEPPSDARTKPSDFFIILLEKRNGSSVPSHDRWPNCAEWLRSNRFWLFVRHR